MNCSGGCEKERLKLEVHRCGREADTLRPPNFLEAEERATGAIFGRRGSAVSSEGNGNSAFKSGTTAILSGPTEPVS
jgi:hypothetical protein